MALTLITLLIALVAALCVAVHRLRVESDAREEQRRQAFHDRQRALDFMHLMAEALGEGLSRQELNQRIVHASNMQALRAPVHRIEACTIRWLSSWRDRPSPSASAMRCMKSSARWRSWKACRRCSSRLSDSIRSLWTATQSAAADARSNRMSVKAMETPAGEPPAADDLTRDPSRAQRGSS
jgi:hypothetical protein